MDLKKLGKIVSEKRKEKKLSLREAAKEIGISHNYLNIIEKASDPRTGKPLRPTIETIESIGESFEIPITILLDLAGYNTSNLERNQTVNDLFNANLEDIPDVFEEVRNLKIEYLQIAKQLQDNNIPIKKAQKIISIIQILND